MSKIRNKYYKNFSKKNILKFKKNKTKKNIKDKKFKKNKTKYNKKGGTISNKTFRKPGSSISKGQLAYIRLQHKFEKCNSELLHELNNIKNILDVKEGKF